MPEISEIFMEKGGITRLRLNSEHFENVPTDINIGNVTLIVGPNNSRKSQMLRDIDYWSVSPEYKMKLLESIDLVIPTEEFEIESLLKPFEFLLPKPPYFLGIKEKTHIFVNVNLESSLTHTVLPTSNSTLLLYTPSIDWEPIT
jgi:hypothetical protein